MHLLSMGWQFLNRTLELSATGGLLTTRSSIVHTGGVTLGRLQSRELALVRLDTLSDTVFERELGSLRASCQLKPQCGRI